MDRRTFLKSASAAGLGMMVAGSMATGAFAEEADVAWDEEVDVLVVGAGTGAYAAVLAKDFGAEKVMIVDKGRWGGTSSTSGGVLWLPGADGDASDVEAARGYIKALATGRENEAAVESYLANAAALAQHMIETHDWPLMQIPGPIGFFDYYEPLEGATIGVRQYQYNLEAGPTMWGALSDLADELGIDVRTNTPATELVVDAEGAVVGAVIQGEEGPIAVKANLGVVLATGGYDYNKPMLTTFQPSKPYVTCATETNEGDGIVMGAAIGAALGNMDTNWGLPSFIAEPFEPGQDVIFDIANVDWGIARAGAGSIIVNKAGRRFGNEASTYAPFNRLFGNFDTATMTLANLPAVWICDAKYVEAGGGLLPGQFASDPGKADNELVEAGEIPANFFQADTLEEIAEHFGIDVDGLLAEVEKFNAYAEAGVDADFHRGERQQDFALAVMHAYGEELPNPSLAPIATPPFSASLYVPGTCGTNGGLVINENAQVMSVLGEPIKGLYAVGNTTASIFGGQYPGGGATLGSGAVMSYAAMKSLLGA